jgi:hypothetical protein
VCLLPGGSFVFPFALQWVKVWNLGALHLLSALCAIDLSYVDFLKLGISCP